MSHLRAHVSDPELHPGMKEIVDLTAVTKVQLGSAAIDQLVAFEEANANAFDALRMAIVASGDLPYGLSRMYEMLNVKTTAQIQVFRDRASAEQWIRAAPEGQ